MAGSSQEMLRSQIPKSLQVKYVCTKNSNIQGRTLNVIKVKFHQLGTAYKGINSLLLGANFFL